MPKPDNLLSDYASLFYRMQRLLDRRMAAQGASLAQAKVLLVIDHHGLMRATDIADLFGLAPRTVTETLDRLERDGLVVREPDAQDRRAKRVRITEEGRRAVGVTEPIRHGLVDRIVGVLDEEERAQLAAIIAKMRARVEQEEDATP